MTHTYHIKNERGIRFQCNATSFTNALDLYFDIYVPADGRIVSIKRDGVK